MAKHAGGRPPKFTLPELMQIAIDAYFDKCDKDKRPYTIMGLAMSLDMCRDTLCEYAKNGQFSDIVKKAKRRVELSVEERLFGSNPAGSIFWLKNHAGYKDRQELEHSGDPEKPVEIAVTQRPQITREEWLAIHALDTATRPTTSRS